MMETHSSHLFHMMSLIFLLLGCQDFLWIATRQLGFLVKVKGVVVGCIVRLHLLVNICPRVVDSQSACSAPPIESFFHPRKMRTLRPEAVNFENSESQGQAMFTCLGWGN